MALPASGQISMDDIRIELGVPTQSPFGLNEARSGTYSTINPCSTNKPPSTGQISLSDWYGYNHTQACDFYEIVFYGTTTDEACFFPDGNFPMTGNNPSYCLSTVFTGTPWVSIASGNYVLEFLGQIRNVTHFLGNNYAQTFDAGCGACPTPTPTPTLTPTPTPTNTPTPTPTSTPLPEFLYYTVDRRATCNTGIENPVAMYVRLPYAFTPTLNYWYRDSAGTCIYSYRISNITPTDPGIFGATPVDAVSYSNSTLACGTGCIPTPTPTPTATVTPTPTPSPTPDPYFYFLAERYECQPNGSCLYIEDLVIANNTDLTIAPTQRYRLDPTTGYVLRVMTAVSSQIALLTTMSGVGQITCSNLCPQPPTPTPTGTPTPTPTHTPTPTPTNTPIPIYTYYRFNVNLADCSTNTPTEVWSYTYYTNGFYTIGGTLYELLAEPHFIYTIEISGAVASSCVPYTPTPTPTATPTPTPTSTPTPAGYDYYNADVYDCSDCGAITETIRVAFDAGSSVILNRFYQPQSGPDGYAYRVTSTADAGIAYILTTIYGSNTTCTLACSV
jgi:hypothetical protein